VVERKRETETHTDRQTQTQQREKSESQKFEEIERQTLKDSNISLLLNTMTKIREKK
jgi:cytidylate kinase